MVRDPIGFFRRMHRRHGDVFTMALPLYGQTVVAASPDAVKSIFTADPSQYNAGEPNAMMLEPLLGSNSLLTLDGAPHMRERKLLLPPFHGDRINRYGDHARKLTRRQMERWPVGKPFSLHDYTRPITVGLILKSVFGIDDEERIKRATILIEENTKRARPIVVSSSLRRNLGRFSPWARFLRSREALDEFIYEEIAIRRGELGQDRDDVLSLLLGARHDDGSPMSDEELRDELMTIVAAGNETSALQAAWAIERLLRTPRALGRLRDSLAADEEDYLAATVKESLRVRPALPAAVRKLNAEGTIGGYRVPAGISVLPAILALHHREDLFPQPDEFRPERFLGKNPANYTWIPFGGGVRRCIGAAFAELEVRVILREIVERADLGTPDSEPERIRLHGALLAPSGGTRVVLNRPLF